MVAIVSFFSFDTESPGYHNYYLTLIGEFDAQQHDLANKIRNSPFSSNEDKSAIKAEIAHARRKLKAVDIWLRYLEPIAYKKINGPLPVEWENEVFEKFEKPYKREGAGLTLAELYIDEPDASKDSLLRLITLSSDALSTFRADSITRQLDSFDHFFLCNRLFLLNLAALYTNGFECPDKKNIINELHHMLQDVKPIYLAYNKSFPHTPISPEYIGLYNRMTEYVKQQSPDYEQFDHYTFIKDYVNPLFGLNQRLINLYGVVSKSYNDYTLNNDCYSIFDKSLYTPQNSKGVYSLVSDKEILSEIRATGKKLFYDPLLSGNNQRSCASCHKPKEFFTDTSAATSLQFDGKQRLPRNTPSLVNVVYNHLLMLDGKHLSLQAQGKDVITNPVEMGGNEKEVLEKVLSCKEYKTAFRRFLKYIPEEKEISFSQIVSAITFYYKDFSDYYAPFDDAMNKNAPIDAGALRGFNLFMGKAQCGTCHYVPQFNGVPPPYISSEFEVAGTPADKNYSRLSDDKGRYVINPAFETMRAYRTNTVRNMEHTAPYMHNGVFTTVDEVIDFYDGGGGAGRKLKIDNQTLAADSLKLTVNEKKDLISFIHSLNEKVIFEEPPTQLPASSINELNKRKPGGTY